MWYVQASGQKQGPLSDEELALQIATARVAPMDYLRRGEGDWIAALHFPFFASLTPRYHYWLWCLQKHPFAIGAKATSLVVASLPITLACVLMGLGIVSFLLSMGVLPSGRYPRIMLALPGLILAAPILYSFGYLVFRASKAVAISLCFLAGLFGLAAAGVVIWVHWIGPMV